MGKNDVLDTLDEEEERHFVRALLADMRALELMLERDLFDKGKRRIGAEQEMFLVNADMGAAPIAMELLEDVNDPRLTTELAQFNVEANVSPRLFEGSCLRDMEAELLEVIDKTKRSAERHQAKVLLTGILPTLRQSDLTLENMTPSPRYKALNDTLKQLRGGDFRFDIKGIDDLRVTHDNVMFESCNTSFQIHFQVSPEEFPKLYNVAQLVTGPVLAAAVNSPLFLGSKLWHETRVALFSSSIEDRSDTRQARGFRPRVNFGDQWVQDSVVEIFREQIARFRVMISSPPEEDPLETLARGEIPDLSALRLHNGTVYRWNRACYGISDGLPHLRIENRVLPAGPTVLDEVANAAFFFGLMSALLVDVGDPRDRMEFDSAKDNFFAAARHGLKAQFTWLDGETLTAAELIEEQLLPMARRGLSQSGILEEDIDRYLGVIEARVGARRTGAKWALESMSRMDPSATKDMKERRLTAAMLEHQEQETPVHLWPLCKLGHFAEHEETWRRGLQSVGQFMSTDLFTVRPTDLVDLAASVMDWEHIKHVPVENESGKLVGLVTHRNLFRLVAQGGLAQGRNVIVSEIMTQNPMIVSPETRTLEALETMREQNVGCLPVVDSDGRLVGIVTQSDLIRVSYGLLERFLKGDGGKDQR